MKITSAQIRAAIDALSEKLAGLGQDEQGDLDAQRDGEFGPDDWEGAWRALVAERDRRTARSKRRRP